MRGDHVPRLSCRRDIATIHRDGTAFVWIEAGWRIAHREERTQIEVWLDGARKRDLTKFFAAAFA